MTDLFDLLEPEPEPALRCECGAPITPPLEKCAECLARAVRERVAQQADSMPKLTNKWGHPTQCDGCLRRQVCHNYTVHMIPLYLCSSCADIADPVQNAIKADVY